MYVGFVIISGTINLATRNPPLLQLGDALQRSINFGYMTGAKWEDGW